jgi:hypothetical protein
LLGAAVSGALAGAEGSAAGLALGNDQDFTTHVNFESGKCRPEDKREIKMRVIPCSWGVPFSRRISGGFAVALARKITRISKCMSASNRIRTDISEGEMENKCGS